MKLFLILLLFVLTACSSGNKKETVHAFPPVVDTIFQKSCATVGCHLPDEHDLDKLAKALHLGADLDLSSWSGLFEGAETGASVVPFRSDKSHLMAHLTGVAQPRMPPNYPPFNYDTLPQSQVDLIAQWIDAGASNEDGDVPFENVSRKLFCTNQGTDVVTVLDQNTMLTMRVFDVGDRPQIESPHGVQASADGDYFYVSMIATGEVFKYDAHTGAYVDKVELLDPVALMKLSPDDSKLYVTTNFQVNNTGVNGSISVVRTSDMTVTKSIPVGVSPHGISVSKDGKYLYVTSVYSDRIEVIDRTTDSLLFHFDVAADVTPTVKYEPYHIGLSPKNSSGYEDYLYISCRKNGSVRIFQRTMNAGSPVFTFHQAVSVGTDSNSKPIQLEVLPNGSAMYVANSNDSSVTVIQKTGTVFGVLTTIRAQFNPELERMRLSQPNGVGVSKDGKYVFVTNRNRDGAVPPHHGGTGGPGLLTVISTATNTILQTIELDPDCYSVFVQK